MLAASFALVVEILESLAFLANACNLVLYLRQYMHMSPSYIFHLWVSLAFSIFINCLFFCSQELLAAVEDEKCMR
ncbi:hypothetical protein JHK85_007281 [Glycine max]|uniref:Nitrate transporter 1.2 n=1 Tax=Glycine soja TaxID=3848 RepID=A0A0B2SRR0_GLYSO|nr:hypothetical protein JHK87_006913 [Glycine soja]KAG5054771.1 hypothetical protein JHK85_007281 [Glycine max]KAG5071866.1 hypothetical protein JHK86_007077 [Glycine max]KHN47578.1 Nitrate transporter 1.2 [Glycine soja]